MSEETKEIAHCMVSALQRAHSALFDAVSYAHEIKDGATAKRIGKMRDEVGALKSEIYPKLAHREG